MEMLILCVIVLSIVFFLKFVFLVKFILMMVMWLVLFSSVIFMIVGLFFDFKVMKLFWI